MDIMCSQHMALLSHGSTNRTRTSYFQRALRRIRRMEFLLPLVEGCLEASPWPLRVVDVQRYIVEWCLQDGMW